MESIFTVKSLLPEAAFLAMLDLKDANLHVQIHANHQRFLRFATREGKEVRHFQYQALPFGLSSVPRIFIKIMLEVMQELRLTIFEYMVRHKRKSPQVC